MQDGGTLIICVNSPLLAQMIKEGGNRQSLVDAIQEVAGRTFAMKLRRAQKVEKTDDAPDPLSSLLSNSREMGISVSENGGN